MSRIENGQQTVTKQLDRHVRFLVSARNPDRDYDLRDAILNDDMKNIGQLRIKQSGLRWVLNPA